MWKIALWMAVMASLAACEKQANPPVAVPKTAGNPTPAATSSAKSPITLSEFEAIARKAPLQATDAQRKAFEQELAALGESLKDRMISDRALFSSANELPRVSGQPKTYEVLCGPAKDAAIYLAALVRTTNGDTLNITSGADVQFSGKIAGARYDPTSEMVVVQIVEGTVQ